MDVFLYWRIHQAGHCILSVAVCWKNCHWYLMDDWAHYWSVLSTFPRKHVYLLELLYVLVVYKILDFCFLTQPEVLQVTEPSLTNGSVLCYLGYRVNTYVSSRCDMSKWCISSNSLWFLHHIRQTSLGVCDMIFIGCWQLKNFEPHFEKQIVKFYLGHLNWGWLHLNGMLMALMKACLMLSLFGFETFSHNGQIRWGGSNEYPQCMFNSKHKKNIPL